MLIFDYFHGDQADQFSFIRIPRKLMTDKLFADLSPLAKMLYALLLDRISLSSKNGWIDEQNRVYIIYQISDIMEDLGLGKKKAMDLLAELESFGLVEKQRRGRGLPNILYVKSFLAVSEATSAEPETEEFSLEEAAREALAVMPEAVLSGEDSVVTADRALIIHLMRNLVNNAVKSGTETPVQVTLHPRGFSVSDEGRGMTEEQIRQCMEPFWKADPARTRASGGAGLGLTICRAIARLHGTDLLIRSAPGQGTTVDFTLPLQNGEYSETAAPVS